jgi:hypothetical protein
VIVAVPADLELVFYRETTDRAVWKIHQVVCLVPIRYGLEKNHGWLFTNPPCIAFTSTLSPGGSHNEEGFFALADVMDVTSADRTSDRQLFDKPLLRPSGLDL